MPSRPRSSALFIEPHRIRLVWRFYLFFRTVRVRPVGFEPTTNRLRGECSTRLSYGRKQLRKRVIYNRKSDIAQLKRLCNTSDMVNRMRGTRSHRDNRRSHHALTAMRFSKCVTCGALHQSHRICMNCGSYNGRKVLDLAAKATRKAAKAKAAAR